jgi:cytochrome c553
MRQVLRLIGISVLLLFGLLVIAYGVIFLKSQAVLERRYPAPRIAIVVPTDAASIAEGQHLATLRGCYLACHGTQGVGDNFIDDPMLGHITAPNLYQAARQYTDPELAALIKDGVRPDGQGVLVMPSQTFHGLSDEDLGRIIAFLRSLPASTGPARRESPGPLVRIGFAIGKFKPAPEMIREAPHLPDAKSEPAQHGRYLAQTICTECHGTGLEGDANPDFTSPDLHVVAGYSQDQFKHLMRDGKALGEREVGLMSQIAVLDFSHMTDQEIDGLYAYLHDFGPVDLSTKAR